jgi:predicted DNA-binding transcriptional regulator YafY
MATNKHAIIRYQTLDKCFRNTVRIYFIEDLMSACADAIYTYTGIQTTVSRRQIFSDINFMKENEGYLIELDDQCKDGKRVYYRYKDVNFSILNQPMNVREEQQLREALLTLSRFKGMPQFDWVEELVMKLDTKLNLNDVTSKVIEFDDNKYLIGKNYISELYESIISKKVLLIHYKSFKTNKEIKINFHPYYLKQYNNRWFVFGRNHTYNSIQNLSLDRIISIEEAQIEYIENDLVDFSEYFEDIIGVSIEQNPKEKVVLKVEKSLLPYIQTKPLHESQYDKALDENYGLVIINVIPNYELESLILSFGERVEVLEPESLREKLKVRVNKLFKNY